MRRKHTSPLPPLPPVIQPQNIRAARHMVNNHGPAAADVARKRAQNLMTCGKVDSAATWLEIACAIDGLAALDPSLSASSPPAAASLASRASTDHGSRKPA